MLQLQIRTQTTPFASVCCSDSFFSIPFVKTPEPYQKLVDEAEKRTAGRATVPDPQICTCLSQLRLLWNIRSLRCTLVVPPLEKQAQQKDQRPYNPPGRALLIYSGRNQRQSTSSHGKLGIVSSQGTSSEHWEQNARPRVVHSGHFGLDLLPSRFETPQLATTSNSLGPVQPLPFPLVLVVLVRHLKSSGPMRLEPLYALRGKLGRNMGAKPLFWAELDGRGGGGQLIRRDLSSFIAVLT